MRRARGICLFALLLLTSHPGGTLAQALPPAARGSGVFSASPSTTESALTLLLPVGAQGVALGRAMTAMRGPESVFWNPAGLAGLDGGRFLILRSTDLAGEATAFSLLLSRSSLGTLGLSYELLDLGDQPVVDDQGNVTGELSFRDHTTVVSFGTSLFSRLDMGLNFKVFQSRGTCRGQCLDAGGTGTTFLVDAGILAYPLSALPLRLGAMVAHMGPDLQAINAEQADPPPTRIRVAAAYEVLRHVVETPEVELWVTAELEDRWWDMGSYLLYLGGELVAGQEDQLFIRAGVGRGQPGLPSGSAVGLGLNYDWFELGIAKRYGGLSSEDSEPVHITFGVVF